MPSLLEDAPGQPERRADNRGSRGSTAWTVVALIVAVVALIVSIRATLGTSADRDRLAKDLQAANARLARVEAQSTSIDRDVAAVKGQATVVADRLGLTQKELQRAQALARKMDQEQEQKLASLGGDVDQVKAGMATQGEAIQKNTADLQRAVGDLGEQSGLIARNRDELEQLKASGERNYVDFDLKKAKQPERVGPVALRLKSSDPKHSRFTVVVTVDDRDIERKDRTLFEPIQFYRKGSHQLNEIVVYQVAGNEVVGYLSLPKQEAGAPSSTSAG